MIAKYKTPEYASWEKMKERCNNPNNKRYARYGGRGITVCKRWDSFDNFLADMGPRPEGFSIDRINNNGHYEPGNCRWASQHEQHQNTSSNRRCKVNGVFYSSLREAERALGLSRKAIRRKIANKVPGYISVDLGGRNGQT